KARARSQVTIDDFDLLPAQRTHPFGHRILEELTFLILSYLFFAGLPKVDNRLASQVLRFDFGIVQALCHCLFPPPRDRPLPEGRPCDRSDMRVSLRPLARHRIPSGSFG